MNYGFSRLSRLGLAAFAAAIVLLSAPVRADIIAPGSTYSAQVLGNSSGNSDFMPITFDGLWESFVRTTVDGNDITIRVTEAQTDLGDGRHLIEVLLISDEDMFPVAGEAGFLGIGSFDPLNLLSPVMVESAFLAFFVGDSLLADADFYATFSSHFANPWDGGFLSASNDAAGWGPVGAAGVNRIHLRITTSAVPVPAPVVLLALGAAMLLVQRRRTA